MLVKSATISPTASLSPRISMKSPRVLVSKTISSSLKIYASASDDLIQQDVGEKGLYRKSNNYKESYDYEDDLLRSHDPDHLNGDGGLVVHDFDNDQDIATHLHEGFMERVSSTSSKRSMRGKSRGIQWAAGSSQRIRRSSTSSFISNTSSSSNNSSVESLINFLTANLQLITTDREYLRRFEEMSADVIAESHDIEVQRIFKAHGWTGARYRNSEDKPVEAASLLQALSNLYLKNKMAQYTSHISNLLGSGDEKGADQILSFCPDLLLTCLKQRGAPKSHEKNVITYTFMGACMLADISGFSKFSGAMCLKGVSGLDDLRDATSGFLGYLVKTVYEFQGDVIAFAGDALICVFLDIAPEPGSKIDDVARYKASGSLRALQCACVLREYRTSKLSAHLGVSYGEMKLALLGGLHDQWVYLMNGQCVSELSKCIDDAGPMEVAATKACYDRALTAYNEYLDAPAPALHQMEATRRTAMRDGIITREDSLDLHSEKNGHADGHAKCIHTRPCVDEFSSNILIDSIDDIFGQASKQLAKQGRRLSQVRKQAISPTHNGVASRTMDLSIPENSLLKQEQMSLLEAAATFVPRPILAAVYSESLDHIGELRQVTTMFLSLDSYSATEHRDPSSLQPFFLTAQKFLFDAGGFLRQFLVDDKGCVFIAMWGMPSFTYANNCSRALYCGVGILKTVEKELGYKTSIGITTGNVFCGSVGAMERRDYAGIGNEVNLAARLMGKAKGRVIIDHTTYANLNTATKELLTPAEEMKLKGMEKPIIPYAYCSPTIPKVAALDESTSGSTVLRKQVKSILSTQMDKISNTNPLTGMNKEGTYGYDTMKDVIFTIILGSPGTGKTTAADYFRHNLRKRNIPCLLIQARPGHEGVPYGLMRELFLELIGDENFVTESQQRQQLTSLIDQAYAGCSDEEKEAARKSVEVVLGVEWSEFLSGNTPVGRDSTHPARTGALSPTSECDCSDGVVSPTSVASNNSGERKVPLKITSSAGNHARSPKTSPINADNHHHPHKNNQTNLLQAHGMHQPAGSTPEHHHHHHHPYMSFGSSSRDPMTPTTAALILEGDSASGLHRPIGDLSFYKLITVLLKTTRTSAIVIEDAHFCDELSWNELHLLLTGGDVNLVVVITMRSNTTVKATNGEPNVTGNGSANTTPLHGTSTGTTRRQSVYSSTQGDYNGLTTPTTSNSNNGEGDVASKYGLKNNTSAAYLSILGHENSIVVEMTSLTLDEVKEILTQTLKVEEVSNNLVKLVQEVSSGNAYWCKAIANFIKERGIKEFEKTTALEGDSSRQNSLKQLILLRMEKLTVDAQLILKHASIIGDQFSQKMLQTIIHERLRSGLPHSLELLVEHGFITCIEEYPEIVFEFENQFIRQTVFELTPPRDAALTHLAIAECIEKAYARNLRPFYPLLAQHYVNCIGKRSLAFKYKVKAADQAISRGAYNDGFQFAQSATKLAVSKEELRVLLQVINRAVRDLSNIMPNLAAIGSTRRRSISGTGTGLNGNPSVQELINSNAPEAQRMMPYLQLKIQTEAALEKLSKVAVRPEDASGSGTKNRLVLNTKQPSGKLNWQPSYVASKLMDDSDSDSDTEGSVSNKATKDCCIIS